MVINGVAQYCPNQLGNNGGCSFSGSSCGCANGGGPCFTSNAACVAANCPPQTWINRQVYSDNQCSVQIAVYSIPSSCTPSNPSACTAITGTSAFERTGCTSVLPSSNNGWPEIGMLSLFFIFFFTFTSDLYGSCASLSLMSLMSVTAVAPGVNCAVTGSSNSVQLSCDLNTGVATYNSFSSANCSGRIIRNATTTSSQCSDGAIVKNCPTPSTTTSTTASTSSTSSSSSSSTPSPTTTAAPSSAPCFHKDTIITYAGKDYTFDEIRVHDDCSVPHVVSAYGVIVSAECGNIKKTLKLTQGHLIYTQRGLQAASDLIPGKDTLFADLSETTKCQVLSITKEKEQHEYFGLNCLNSQVIANGLKASTFEKLHSIPAFWMQIAGRILGVRKASQLGDHISELVQKMNLI